MDVTAWRNGEGLMIHLVNMTTTNAMRGPASEILPLNGITVQVRNDLIKGNRVISLEMNQSGRRGERSYTRVTLPALRLHEVVIFQ